MGDLTISPVIENTSTMEQELSSMPSDIAITVNVVVDKKIFLFISTRKNFAYTITGGPVSDIYVQSLILFTLEGLIAASVNQYDAPHHVIWPRGNGRRNSIVVAGSARALAHFLEKGVREQGSEVNALVINDAIKPYSISNGVNYLGDLFSQIQPDHFQHLTRLSILVVPGISSILAGITSLFERGCLPQIKHIALPFSVKSQPRLHHSGRFCAPAKSDILQLCRLYDVIADKDMIKQLKHVRFTLQTQKVTTAALNGLPHLYPQLKTLIIDYATPTAKVKCVYDHTESYYVRKPYRHWVSRDFFQAVLFTPAVSHPGGLSVLDDMVRANALNNQLESLELYGWVPGHNFSHFDQARLANYLNAGYLPHIKKISLCSPIDSPVPANYRLSEAKALDTSDLLNAALPYGERIKTLQLLMPEKTGYIPWLLQIVGGAFKNLTYLSYRLPDRLEGENDIVYESKVEYVLQILEAIADVYTQLRACLIEGNLDMLSKFKTTIDMIDDHCARNRENIEEFID